MNKVSKITKVSFSSEWKSPSGGIVYYHELEFANGDSGNCGRNKKLPEDMQVGMEIEYVLNDKKIKFVKATEYMNNTNNFKKKTFSSGKRGPEEYLGYAYAYAKDMVVAGKTSQEDIKNLGVIAESIYAHIKELLKNDNEDKQPF